MRREVVRAMGGVRVWHRRVGSTMDIAMALGMAGAPHGTLVEADEQTAGRGRLGRRWVAPEGSAFLGTWLLRIPSGIDLAALSPAVAAGVLRALTTLAPDAPVRYKWPNDVLIDGRKVAGILLTARATAGESLIAAGTGINVYPGSVPPELAATCLSEWADVSVADVRGRVASELDAVVPGMITAGRLPDDVLQQLETCMALRDQPIEVLLPDGPISGIATGLAPHGGLRLMSLDGTDTRVLHVGEIARGPRVAPEAAPQTTVYLQDNKDC